MLIQHYSFVVKTYFSFSCKEKAQYWAKKEMLWQTSRDIWGDIGFLCLRVWHKTENLCRRESQIELITWQVQSPRLCGLKHYRHFNFVLCNKHQHRRRGNQFQYNCPKMGFLAAIIPHGSQSKHSHWQCWRLFTLARWTFITIDFCCLQPCHFYTL